MKSGNQKGFTLLELLVAVALTSIVILGVMAVFRNMLITYAQIRDSRESAMQLRVLTGLLGDDLLTMSREFPFTGSTGERDGRAVRLLAFVSGVSVERQDAEPALTRVLVVYSLIRTDDEELWTLARGERPHPSIAGDWKESPMPVLRNLETLKFYFEGSSGAVQDFWSAPPGGVLPAFVRLEAVFRHGGKTVSHFLRFPVSRRS